MKKIICTSIILSLILFIFPSCDKIEKNDNTYEIETKFEAEDNDFLYKSKFPENVNLFAVSDTGEQYNFIPEANTIIVYDLNGEKIDESEKIKTEGFVNNGVAIIDEIFYFSYSPILFDSENNSTEPSNDTEIYSYDFNTKSQEKVVVIEGFIDVCKIVPDNDILYLFGRDTELAKEVKNSGEHDYGGEIVKSHNLKNGKTDTAFKSEKMPVMIAEMQNNGVMLFAYDENDGYYFKKLNSDTKIFNNDDKLLNEIRRGGIFNFEMFGETSVIYKLNSFIYISSIDGSNDSREIVNDVENYRFSGIYQTGFAQKSGYFYIATEDGIRRINLTNILNRNPLNIAVTSAYRDDVPPPVINKLGFGLNFKMIPYNEFSLSLLSQGSDYDFYYLNSNDDISDNIRKKGAFQSLNDVPYVKEYIDACFPYVKETAYNEDGEIWMIPVYLSIDGVVYNENLCKEYGIEPKSIKSLEELAITMSKIRDIDAKVELQLFFGEYLYKYFYQLIYKNNGFNRNDFEKMAKFFYENMNFKKENFIFESSRGNGLTEDDFKVKIGDYSVYDSREKNY